MTSIDHCFEGSRVDRDFLDALFDELFPIMRSISGVGLLKSINILQRYMPLEIEMVPSGTLAFDWTVPPEWHFRSARLLGPDGRTVIDAANNSLHVLNYSHPVDKRLSLEELQSHLYSLPELPAAIPYVTSYYKPRWGFCLSDEQRRQLPEGTYRAVIDSEFVESEGVPFAHCVLQGESQAEIVLTSYLCHPSMANNELSGPLTLLGLYDRILAWPRRRYTYRFVINPETIGSVCYLSRYSEHLKENMQAGLVLTCTGGPEKHLSYKCSRRGDSLLDRLSKKLSQDAQVAHELIGMPLKVRPFSPTSGSDERQYCSPGFNLPVGQMARTLYGEYPGYHNSLDNKEFMGIDALVETIEATERFLKLAELAGNFINLSPYGEPQLGKRNLYPSESWTQSYKSQSHDNQFDERQLLNHILMILNYSDGQHDMIEIADLCGVSVADLRPAIEILEREQLIRGQAK